MSDGHPPVIRIGRGEVAIGLYGTPELGCGGMTLEAIPAAAIGARYEGAGEMIATIHFEDVTALEQVASYLWQLRDFLLAPAPSPAPIAPEERVLDAYIHREGGDDFRARLPSGHEVRKSSRAEARQAIRDEIGRRDGR